MTLALAREYGLALRAHGERGAGLLRNQGLPAVDHGVLDSFSLDTAGKSARYARLLRGLPAGLSEWAVHPGLDTLELRAIQPGGWQVRQTDFDFVTSPQAREIVEREGIILLSYAPLQALWRSR